MRWLRATGLLTWTEALRLSRTGQVFRYFLVPALVGVPALVLVAVLISSFEMDKGRIAIPAESPVGLPLVAALEAEELSVVVSDDPGALWERGEVDAAIVHIEAGDGIGGRGQLELATSEAWLFDLQSDDRAVSGRVESAVEAVAEAEFDAIVSASGGRPGDVRVATITQWDFKEEPFLGFDLPRAIRAYALFTMGLISMFFLTLPMVSDRREGVTETMRALPSPITAMLWSRTLATTGLQLVGAALFAANFFLLMPLLAGTLRFPSLWVELPGFAAALLVTNTLFVAVGVVSGSARAANNISSLAFVAQLGLLVFGAVGDPWPGVPLAGVVAADTAAERALGVVGCVLFAVANLTLCGWLLRTRVSLVLPGGAA